MEHHEHLKAAANVPIVRVWILPARRREQETGVLQIKVRLDGEMLKRYNEIKRRLGLEHDSEIIRWMITHYHEELKPLSR